MLLLAGVKASAEKIPESKGFFNQAVIAGAWKTISFLPTGFDYQKSVSGLEESVPPSLLF